MNLVRDIEQAMEMDGKSTLSDKIYNTIALSGALLSVAFYIASMILYYVDQELGLYIFTILFYPMLILIVLSLFFSVPQIIRNRFMSSAIAIIVVVLLSAALITTLILQGVFLGTVYVIPFIYF